MNQLLIAAIRDHCVTVRRNVIPVPRARQKAAPGQHGGDDGLEQSVVDLVARMPTPEESARLALPPGVPVVSVTRTVFDAADLPVEVQDSLMAAGRHEFRYEERMR